jgi:hypothetical protein
MEDNDDDNYGSSEWEEDLEEEGPAIASTRTRGLTRSGGEFRRANRGYYSSMAELVRAHPKTFSKKPTLYLIGERREPILCSCLPTGPSTFKNGH